jgi:anti-anti-sigma factor
MAFDIRKDDADPGRIALAGELDLSAVACLEEVVEQALTDPRVTLVVLDLARATFLDSSALGALVRGRRAATAGSSWSTPPATCAGSSTSPVWPRR